MSDSEISNSTTESWPYTNGNPVKIDVKIQVNTPAQVQTEKWPYAFIVEVSWSDPVIGNRDRTFCSCEVFKEGSSTSLLKENGQFIKSSEVHSGIKTTYRYLAVFHPKDKLTTDGNYFLRMTSTVMKGSIENKRVNESNVFTVSKNVRDDDIKPSKNFIRLHCGKLR